MMCLKLVNHLEDVTYGCLIECSLGVVKARVQRR